MLENWNLQPQMLCGSDVIASSEAYKEKNVQGCIVTESTEVYK